MHYSANMGRWIELIRRKMAIDGSALADAFIKIYEYWLAVVSRVRFFFFWFVRTPSNAHLVGYTVLYKWLNELCSVCVGSEYTIKRQGISPSWNWCGRKSRRIRKTFRFLFSFAKVSDDATNQWNAGLTANEYSNWCIQWRIVFWVQSAASTLASISVGKSEKLHWILIFHNQTLFLRQQIIIIICHTS